MNNFWALTKINIQQLFIGSFNVDKNTKKKKILTMILLGVLFAYLVGWMGFLGYQIGQPLKSVGMEILLLLLAFIMTSLTLLIQVIFSSFNIVFKAKDYEFLATLPIKQFTVVSSKLFGLYLFSLSFSSVFFIPLTTMYFVFSGFSFVSFLIVIAGFLLLPLFPIFVGLLLSLIINLIVGRMKNKSLFAIIFSLIFTIALMYISRDFNNISAAVIVDADASFKTMSGIYFPAMLISNAAGNLNWLQFLYFILISVLPLALLTYIISWKYKELNNFFAKSARTKEKAYKAKSSRVTTALMKKEFGRIFSSPMFFINSCTGPILLSVFGIISLLGKSGTATIAPGISGYQFVLLIMPMCILLMSPTSATFSIEGDTFWMLKNLPIKFKQIAWAKFITYFIIFLIPSILGAALLSIALKLTWYETLSSIAIIFASIILVLLIGIAVNLNLYNLHWTNEVAVVKQSASVFVSMIIGMVVGLVPGLIITLFLTPYMSALNWGWVLCGFLLLMSLALFIYIRKKGEALFNRMV